MIYANDMSWAFIHIPKTGGKNIRHNAKQCEHVTIADSNMPLHYNHQPASWWKSKGIINNDTHLYSIVRNPYNRLASLYMHVSRRFEMTFHEFVFNKMTEIDETVLADLKWKLKWTQSQFLDDNVRVFKLETSYCELETITGITYKHTHHNKSANYNIQDLFCQETADYVFEYYAEDFERFNYEHIRMQF